MRAAVGRPSLVVASRDVWCFEHCTVSFDSVMLGAKGLSCLVILFLLSSHPVNSIALHMRLSLCSTC